MNYDISLNKKRFLLLKLSLYALIILIFIAGLITGIMIQATESLKLAEKSEIKQVPKTVIIKPPAVEVTKIPPKPKVEKPAPQIPAPRLKETPPEKMPFSVQVGAFLSEKRANVQITQLRERGYEPYIYKAADSKKKKWYTVRIGDYKDMEKASLALSLFKEKEKMPAFINYTDSLDTVKSGKQTVPFEKLSPGSQMIPDEPDEPGEDEKDTKEAVHIVSEETGEKISFYPYTLKLSCFRSHKEVRKAVSYYKNRGLSPCFVKVDKGENGVWRIIYTGNYKTREDAGRAKEELKLTDSIIKKIPYANLIGIFTHEIDMTDMLRRLEDLGYFPYVIKGAENSFRLFVGAFITREGAEDQKLELQADGIESQVVLR